jgi:hypothetical protein
VPGKCGVGDAERWIDPEKVGGQFSVTFLNATGLTTYGRQAEAACKVFTFSPTRGYI